MEHFKASLEQTGLPKTVRFHDLRHTCATLMIKQSIHPRVVMEILGHSQIATTMNTYAHVLPDVQRAAVVALEALFTSPEATPSASEALADPADDTNNPMEKGS